MYRNITKEEYFKEIRRRKMFMEYVSFTIKVFQPVNLFHFKICEGQQKRSVTTSFKFVINAWEHQQNLLIVCMTAACAQIPSSIDDVHLDRRAYHKQCYINFIKDLDHCQTDQSSIENEEVRNRSPRKRKSTDTLFPAECTVSSVERKSVTMIQNWRRFFVQP